MSHTKPHTGRRPGKEKNMKELRDAITGRPINWTAADAREGNLCFIEGIAEKLQGLRAALEDVSTDKAKDDVMRGACARAARQLQAIANGEEIEA